MRFLLLSILVFTLPAFSRAQEKLLSPAEFLGYESGERFTTHNRAVDYFKHVAAVLPNAEIYSYGETYEHRPLVYLVITSQANFENLQAIRMDNLRRAGLAEGRATGEKKAIVWLSYNVHGNEASSMEASMLTLYELANPANTKAKEWLKNTVVIIDPCINPDGRDRYANFYNQYGSRPANPAIDAVEHQEPWPGGRTNHYFFDLNRDWAWCTQVESQQRLKVYNQWMPHLHVDFHEQGYNSPYFFAPAAEPLHEVVSQWQREFQTLIGKNNARYFDEKGWLYFTKEVFDLYYPSYGDTYPTYNGAIGMTYEQGGGGAGGLAVTTETGEPLTLKDRILHHHTSALSTIEVASLNASRVVDEFEKYFQENNNNPSAQYKTYVIKATNDADKLRKLTTWMDGHSIRYGRAAASRSVRGFNYQTQGITTVNVVPEDLVISTYQPKSRFITTIFQPSSHLSDSLTYDITAWNLMYAFNLEAYALTDRINAGRPFEVKHPGNNTIISKPYAYIFKYQNLRDVAFLSALMQSDIKVRCAQRSFAVNGQTFAPGTLIVTRRNNENVVAFDNTILNLANKFERSIYTANTGFVEQGKDLGSGELVFLSTPRIAALFGDQTSSLSSGELWHFFEQQIQFPITQILTGSIRNVNLKKYDVLIVPEGSYKIFDDPILEKLSRWVEDGGHLILIGNALNSFLDKKGFGLKKYSSVAEKDEAEQAEKDRQEREGLPRYEQVERKQLSENISGAIYKVNLDNSHPLAFAMRPFYFTLKNHERRFAWLSNGWNIAYFKGPVKPVQGFAGFNANRTLENSLLIGMEDIGQGKVIYFVDNPLFRSFWEDGKMLFANAVFMVAQ